MKNGNLYMTQNAVKRSVYAFRAKVLQLKLMCQSRVLNLVLKCVISDAFIKKKKKRKRKTHSEIYKRQSSGNIKAPVRN